MRISRTSNEGRTWLNGRLLALLAGLLALGLFAAACEADDVAEPVDEEPVDEEPVDEEPAPEGTITLGWIPWEENIANTNLWAEILEEEGYDVELTQVDVAPVFAGVAGGDLDLFLDVWLDDTHAPYWDEFSEQFIDMGVWYEPATLELTVPAYVDEVDTLEDLAENPDLFDGQITGIESGAGMMALLRDSVMPEYGLDEEFELLESSTSAMRAELERAYEAEEPIVVTLWTPHPEYGLKDLKRLEDPAGAWGTPERLHAIAREGFEDDFPQVAEWIRDFEMTEEQLAELSAAVEEAGDGEERDAARDWIEDNRDVVDGWLGR